LIRESAVGGQDEYRQGRQIEERFLEFVHVQILGQRGAVVVESVEYETFNTLM
jgi:hypothetical protein